MKKQQDTFEYLKPEQHYNDRYDLRTIEDCLHYYQSLHKKLPELIKMPYEKDETEEKRKNDWGRLMNMTIYSLKVHHFKHKKETIDKWMGRDRKVQEAYDSAEPGEFYCKNCDVLLNVIDKNLWDRNDKVRVLFMYKCPRCNKREAYYDDGELYVSTPTLCEKCGSEIDVNLKIDDNKDITTWIYKCTGCSFEKTDVDDHKKWKEEREKENKRNKELLEKFKKDFCFSEKEGSEAVTWMENFTTLMSDIKKDEEKKKDPVYQKAVSLKKLKVVELNKLLKEAMEKEGFTDLQLEKPEMGKYVAVPFVVQDSKAEREEYDSKKQLKKLIDKSLEDTNWKLMSEGLSYRVGYLSGRLRCYESEDDQTNMLKSKL